MRTRQSIVLPLPTSPVTFTSPSPAVIAYTSASSVAPRLAPEKKNSVCGVMRKGASRSPKCSRYIVIGCPSAACVGIGRSQFSTGATGGFEPSVERRARDAEQLRRLRHVALRDLQRGIEVGLLHLLQHGVQAEGLAGRELRARPRHRVPARNVRRGCELGFELRGADRISG